MTEDLHNLTRVHVEVYEQGRAGSAAVVHGDLSYPGPRHAGPQDRLKFLGSTGVPDRVVEISFDRCHAAPAALM